MILIERQEKQRPPDRLQREEIVPIAQRIPRTWEVLAILTKFFAIGEIDDILYHRIGEDESHKTLSMLTRYFERGGTRQMLADALKRLKMISLAEDVLSGSFISDQ